MPAVDTTRVGVTASGACALLVTKPPSFAFARVFGAVSDALLCVLSTRAVVAARSSTAGSPTRLCSGSPAWIALANVAVFISDAGTMSTVGIIVTTCRVPTH